MVKKIVTIFMIINSIILIVIGHIYWKEKIHQSVEQALSQNGSTAMQKEGKQQEEWKRQLLEYASNLPEAVQQKIETAVSSKQPVQFVIFGSEATSADPTGWPNLLKQSLDDTYGADIFSITIKEYKDMTTTEAIEEKIIEDVIALKPDVILFEPFILNNNGALPIEQTLEDITKMLTELQSSLSDVVVMLQPAHPIYRAIYYPREVEQLKQYAEENGYIYLDHWVGWPDYKSDEIKKYVTEDNNTPTEEGHRLWADFLKNYFIAKKQ
ncbi:SGNH/GDSL hydrolase family protein [Bacillus alveayuensis]|uniref:SGNH/GDSL hydrolase family protein n=1 Tax=Aeribacillus alveayuensis TaxID=279215 RepID=UPI000696828E|nr:hypothetical protein [Bacillus alveayuensis]